MSHATTCVFARCPRLSLGVLSLLAVVLGAIASIGMAPEPDPVPRRWQLAVEPGPLRMATFDVPGRGPAPYFFLTYKVTNTSSTDLLFTPMFDLVTEDGQIYRSGRDVPSEVTRAALELLSSPFLQDQVSIVGMLLQGEANAKEGLVIWPVPAMEASELSVFASGFSGETRGVPVKGPDGKTHNVLLRKSLMIRYKPPGDLRAVGSNPVVVSEQRWVMR
jgi:hypothetical protein